jgi:isopenicillin N synthase-like dioxygenase
MSGSLVPVIDVSALASDDLAERQALAARIGDACRSTGFFSVVGHGLDDELLDAVFAQSRRFFSQSKLEKEKIATNPFGDDANRGYDDLGSQRLDPTAEVDCKESFMIGVELDPDDPLVRAGATMSGRNRWPDLPGFQETLLEYQAAARDLAFRLLRSIALSLDLDEGHFEPYHQHPVVGLRLLRYPPRPDGAGARDFGCGAHTDWGAITVLAQDATGSLQVQGPDGTWVDVEPHPGALVINLGDLIEVWTNGRYRSTMHRVLGGDRDRYSIALFCDLDVDAVIECLPTCTGPDDPPRYPPTTVAQHLQFKFDESMQITR